ncbi:uncharacterized protein LOC114867141 [Betta splendens]|uniref:Uncharacterized protein LOC114867141 n=1 Tax=Betta splendens TaxID=158456 RepID=A0A6P7P5Q7_BETSP|nr:uncharacterized protein LOC114867141 [Betta splendens]
MFTHTLVHTYPSGDHHSMLRTLHVMDASKPMRIVILGKTGSGKSSLANTLFGQRLFAINHTQNSETGQCQAQTKAVRGREVTLIDTPGFFDTDRSEEEMKPEIVRCITECSPGPHAFLLVLKVEKYTEHEKAVVSKICEYFSQEVFKYATVLFTHGDQLPEGQTIQDFVSQNEFMSDLVKKCGGRCHVFDNKYWNKPSEDEYRSNRFQVEQLLKTIDKTVEENQGHCYTNEMLQAVEENIRQEEQRIRETSGNMSEEEIREQAKANVYKELMIIVAGVATGTLLGTFFGVVVMVGMVNILLKSSSESVKLREAIKTTAAATAGGAAGVVGGAAAGGAAGFFGWTLATGPIAFATVGAVRGGIIGYDAAEGAATAGEAAKRTLEAVKSQTQSVLDETNKALERVNIQTPNTRRIVLLGKTGAGKSSLANIIFGENLFTISHTLNPETKECTSKTKTINGKHITLIDTPGFYDPGRSEGDMKAERVRCTTECAPGPHAFLIVLKVEKYTAHEKAVITRMCKHFSEEALTCATVVFTHGDQLSDMMKIEEFVDQSEGLTDLVKRCGGRCHVVDNKYWNNQEDEYRNNKFQVAELLNTIEQVVIKNKGKCYTNKMLQAVEKEIHEEQEHIRRSSVNKTEEEIRQQAKGTVFKRRVNETPWTWLRVVMCLAAVVGLLATGTAFIRSLKALSVLSVPLYEIYFF